MNDQLKEILAKVQATLDEHIFPLETKYHSKPWDIVVPHLDKVREKVKAAGLWIPQIPTEYGGLGLSVAAFGEVSALLGSSPYGHYCFNCQAPDAGNMEILIEFGTENQKAQYLMPLLAGDIRSCFSMTEPDHPGSNPTIMGTIAIKDGEDYVINGHKWFTSAADGATFAIVMVVSDPHGTDPHRMASQIIVSTDNPGFNLIRNISVMGEKGSGWHSHAEIKYENCRVPTASILGSEGDGFAIAQKRLGPGRIHHCMRWIGICERAFDMMCKRAVSREISPGKTLADKQTIQHWIAESRAEIHAAKLMVRDAAYKIDTIGASKARIEISMIKFYSVNLMQSFLDRAIQVHGALGISDDTILATWFRLERSARIYDGADEVHKSSTAKQILKNYR